jgi:hypothetical protein
MVRALEHLFAGPHAALRHLGYPVLLPHYRVRLLQKQQMPLFRSDCSIQRNPVIEGR